MLLTRCSKELMDRVSLTRYHDAKHDYDRRAHPVFYRDHGWIKPKPLNTGTSNGLTAFCINYLLWTGNYGNRINTMGRMIKSKNGKAVMIQSSTRKGTSDINAIIKDSNGIGRSCHIEIKINDRQSDHQKREELLVNNAGGLYIVVKTPEEFLDFFDRVSKL